MRSVGVRPPTYQQVSVIARRNERCQKSYLGVRKQRCSSVIFPRRGGSCRTRAGRACCVLLEYPNQLNPDDEVNLIVTTSASSHSAGYPARLHGSGSKALMEAWIWLEREGSAATKTWSRWQLGLPHAAGHCAQEQIGRGGVS